MKLGTFLFSLFTLLSCSLVSGQTVSCPSWQEAIAADKSGKHEMKYADEYLVKVDVGRCLRNFVYKKSKLGQDDYTCTEIDRKRNAKLLRSTSSQPWDFIPFSYSVAIPEKTDATLLISTYPAAYKISWIPADPKQKAPKQEIIKKDIYRAREAGYILPSVPSRRVFCDYKN